jgi:cysteinyl-tRNA synthetase
MLTVPTACCSIKTAQAAFRAALCDSFDSYLRLNRSNLGAPTAAAEWIGRMLRMLGLGEGPKTELGWGSKEEAGAGADVRATLELAFVCSPC